MSLLFHQPLKFANSVNEIVTPSVLENKHGRLFDFIHQSAIDSGLRPRQPKNVEFEKLFTAAIAFASNANSREKYTLASYRSSLCDLHEDKISDSGLNQRLSKEEVPDFLMRVLTAFNKFVPDRVNYKFGRIARKVARKVGVQRVMTIDGTYLKVLKSTTYECKAGQDDSGIAIHPVVCLNNGTIVGFSVSQSACNERLYIFEELLEDVLLYCDRGYYSYDVANRLVQCGTERNVKFIFRVNPQFTMDIKDAINQNGEPVSIDNVQKINVDLSDSANHSLDLLVRIYRPKGNKSSSEYLDLRLICSYNPKSGAWNFFLTNIPRDELDGDLIALSYKLRWACEMFYKCCKSFGSLVRGINSRKLNIVLFFIVATICVMVFRTFIASFINLKDDEHLSLINVHKHIGDLTLVIFKIYFIYQTINSALAYLSEQANKMKCFCITYHVSKRDLKNGRSYDVLAKEMTRAAK